MKKILIICLLSVGYCKSKAQNYVLSPLGIKFPNYTTINRPAANSLGVGTVIYNTTDNVHQFSNGISWLNLLGTTSVPSGTANQTLRNNGSGWVADGLIKNLGNKIIIGTDDGTYGYLLSVQNTDNGASIYAKSTTGTAVVAGSSTGTGIATYSSENTALYAQSISNTAIEGFSGASYGGEFYGRLRIKQGGNGSAGIEFTRDVYYSPKESFFGLGFANEMGIFGFGYNNWIQRWNVVTGTICHATAPTICSDIRLKKDFKSLSNSLESIRGLKGYNYYLRNEKNPNLQTGFIAQEIQKIFPELVTTGSDGYLSVDYTGLIPHLVESVKSLKNENEFLLQRLNKIEELLKISDNKLEVTANENPLKQ